MVSELTSWIERNHIIVLQKHIAQPPEERKEAVADKENQNENCYDSRLTQDWK